MTWRSLPAPDRGDAWSDQIVFPEYFTRNPDSHVPEYQTKYGIYEPNCGVENVHMSFGHDGYIAEVMKTEATSTLSTQPAGAIA